MTSQTFESLVEEVGASIIYSSPRGYVVETGAAPNRPARRYSFTTEDLPHNAASDVARVLGKGGPCRVMKQFTRIVGYYSNIANWNASKLAELRDRHLGDYEVH